jgi:hypothetical protein
MGTQYSHLSEADRVAIQLLLQSGYSYRAATGLQPLHDLPGGHSRQGRADGPGRQLSGRGRARDVCPI